jgi:hypothetical protein
MTGTFSINSNEECKELKIIIIKKIKYFTPKII